MIARGVVKFADIALTITDHVRTMRYEADAHDLIDRAYDHLQAQDSKLAPRTENTADLVENDPRYTAEKKLERALAAHATLLKNLEQKVADYDAMSVEQRANFLRKEAARNELSPEAKKILDEQRKDVKGLREKLDSLTEEAQPELRKSLQDQIAIEEARIKKSEDALIDKRDRLMSMSEEEIRAEAESKRPPAEIAELRKASAERTKGVRDQIRELEHSDKAYTKANPAGAAKSPELKRAERIVAKLQKQLEKAKIIDAKDFERTKVAAKAEGFDVDNIEHWKDPETMTHYLNWLEGRNVSTLFALPKTLITWALHASAKVVPKKALADLIHVTNDAILKPIISPLVGSALHKLGAGREGMADVGEYRHTIPALFRGIMDGVTDALNVAKGMEPKFEAYAEHARVDPLLAKTSGTTWRRAAVRAGQWLSLLTPVRIVHAFASNIAARTKVAAHAYRQAVDSHGNRLKGQQLTDFMNREMENPKSESWRMAVLDAQRATYTEPLPKWLAKYSAWKSGHSKDSMVSNAWRLHAHSWTPFTQIPFNRGRRIASDWTPILSDAYTVIRFFSGKNEAGHDAAGKPKFERNLTKRDIPDAIVQAAVRWFLGYQAMQLVNTISADGHPVLIGDDKDKEKAFTIATGDGHRRKYLEAGSMGPGMGVFAGAAQGANSKIGPISGGLDSIVQLMSKEYQASLLQPILSVINSARYQPASRTTAEKAQAVIAETIGSKAAMLVPSIKGQIENAMADRKPDYTDSKKSNNFLDQVKHGAEVKASPGSLPRKGGEKDVDSAGWITFLDRLLNPMMLEGEKPKGKH